MNPPVLEINYTPPNGTYNTWIDWVSGLMILLFLFTLNWIVFVIVIMNLWLCTERNEE